LRLIREIESKEKATCKKEGLCYDAEAEQLYYKKK